MIPKDLNSRSSFPQVGEGDARDYPDTSTVASHEEAVKEEHITPVTVGDLPKERYRDGCTT